MRALVTTEPHFRRDPRGWVCPAGKRACTRHHLASASAHRPGFPSVERGAGRGNG